MKANDVLTINSTRHSNLSDGSLSIKNLIFVIYVMVYDESVKIGQKFDEGYSKGNIV